MSLITTVASHYLDTPPYAFLLLSYLLSYLPLLSPHSSPLFTSLSPSSPLLSSLFHSIPLFSFPLLSYRLNSPSNHLLFYPLISRLLSLVSYFFIYPSTSRIRGRVYRRRHHCQTTRNYWSKNNNDYQFWSCVLLFETKLYNTMYLILYHANKVTNSKFDILIYNVPIWCYFDWGIAIDKALKITSDTHTVCLLSLILFLLPSSFFFFSYLFLFSIFSHWILLPSIPFLRYFTLFHSTLHLITLITN